MLEKKSCSLCGKSLVKIGRDRANCFTSLKLDWKQRNMHLKCYKENCIKIFHNDIKNHEINMSS